MKIIILSRTPEIYSTSRLVEAAKNRGHEVHVVDHTKCSLLMEKAKPSVRYKGEYLKNVDIIIPRIGASVTTFGASVIRHFDMMGVSSLLTSTALIRSRDKLRSLQIMSKSGIGIPKSVFARHPKSNDIKIMIDEVGGAPVILKLLEGTHGTGVVKVDSVSSAKSTVEAFSGIKKDIIVQEFIEEAKGKDIRVFVVNSEVVGAMERSGQDGEFRSNLHKGGVAIPYDLSAKEKSIAIEAANLHGLTVAGVDMIISSRGPLIIEVNSAPGLQGIEKATNIDIASKIIEAAEKKYTKRQKTKRKSRKKKKKDNNE